MAALNYELLVGLLVGLIVRTIYRTIKSLGHQ